MSKRLYDLMDEVREWNIAAGHMKRQPENLADWEEDKMGRDLAASLIVEEVFELKDAVFKRDQVETLDALADILFTVFGAAAKSGHLEILEEGLEEVIESNWTKLKGEKVVLPNGKIGKPKGYKPPKLEPIVKKAQKRGFVNE